MLTWAAGDVLHGCRNERQAVKRWWAVLRLSGVCMVVLKATNPHTLIVALSAAKNEPAGQLVQIRIDWVVKEYQQVSPWVLGKHVIETDLRYSFGFDCENAVLDSLCGACMAEVSTYLNQLSKLICMDVY